MNFSLYTISRKNFLSRTYLIYQHESLVYKARVSWFYKSCVLLDLNGHKIFKVRRHLSPFNKKFTITLDGNTVATVKSDGVLTTKLIVEQSDNTYHIEGNAFKGDFTIFKDLDEVAKMSRKALAIKNKIGLAIHDNQDDEFILILALMLEIMIQSRKSRSG